MCEGIIGLWNDYDNSMFVGKFTLYNIVKHNLSGYSIEQYCDKRCSTNLTRFNYCPDCGKPIDWKAVKNDYYEWLKTQQKE